MTNRYLLHSTSGLIYLRARYYDPTSGVFLSRDPVMGIVGGQSVRWNPYTYAGANPINYVDPNGKLFWFALGAIGIAAAKFVGGAAITAGIDGIGQCIEMVRGMH